MTIIGYRKGANSLGAILSVKKHTSCSLLESKKLIESVLNGQAVQLDEDFVLREELSQLNFIVK
jgi:hypothetical protein